MGMYAVWPYFVLMAILLLLAATPFFRAADAPPNSHGPRLSTLDGLRGFLALGVFFHHAAIYHEYLLDGSWQLPPSAFYTLLGQAGVSAFFMITGFLFWSRLLKEHGRPDWLRLYIGRLFRIGPLYLFAVVSALLIVFAKVGVGLQVPLFQLAVEFVHWFSLGLLSLTPVNGYANAPTVLAGVTWTLRFEWLFYFSLLLLAPVAGKTRLHLPFTVGALMLAGAYVHTHAGSPFASRVLISIPFLIGMLCGSLAAKGFAPRLPDRAASAIVAILVCVAFLVFKDAYNIGAITLFGGAFYLIISGCTVFGLLTSRPSRRLGDVSYGIYLLQGLSFALVFAIGPMREFAIQSPLAHWSVVLLCAVLLVSGATATHVFIERVGIEIGKRFANAVRVPEKSVVAAQAAAYPSLPLALRPASVEAASDPETNPAPQ